MKNVKTFKELNENDIQYKKQIPEGISKGSPPPPGRKTQKYRENIYYFLKWLIENNNFVHFISEGELKFVYKKNGQIYNFDDLYDFYEDKEN